MATGIAQKGLRGILLVVREPKRYSKLKRITKHIHSRWSMAVCSIAAADTEMMRRQPDVVIIDTSDFDAEEFQRRIAPFVLELPGWIETYIVDNNPTLERVTDAVNAGVLGVLHAPLSHHGITVLLDKVVKA